MTTPPKSTERVSVLASLSPQTRGVALVALIVEALFLTGALLLPESERLYAFGICALLLVVAIIACALLEARHSPTSPQTATSLVLPPSLQHTAIFIDEQTKMANGQVAAIYRTGINLKFAGRFADAIKQFSRALQLDPDHTKAKYNIASCLLYQGNLDDAEARFRRLADELTPRSGSLDALHVELLHGCFLQMNKICSERKQFASGIPLLVDSLSVKPDDALSYLNLVVACIKCGKNDEARKWYEALMEHPEKFNVLTSLPKGDRSLIDGLGPRQKRRA